MERKYQCELGIMALGILALGIMALGSFALGIFALGKMALRKLSCIRKPSKTLLTFLKVFTSLKFSDSKIIGHYWNNVIRKKISKWRDFPSIHHKTFF